jgi:hypothetical protein
MKVLHWYDSSLVWIKEFEDNETLMVLSIGELDFENEKDIKKLEMLQETILKWNTKKKYDMVKNNCQNFCLEALSSLGFSLNFNGQISMKY